MFRVFVRVTKAWQERARSERGCPGLFCLRNMLLGNNVVSTIVLREVSSIMDVVIETQYLGFIFEELTPQNLLKIIK